MDSDTGDQVSAGRVVVPPVLGGGPVEPIGESLVNFAILAFFP